MNGFKLALAAASVMILTSGAARAALPLVGATYSQSVSIEGASDSSHATGALSVSSGSCGGGGGLGGSLSLSSCSKASTSIVTHPDAELSASARGGASATDASAHSTYEILVGGLSLSDTDIIPLHLIGNISMSTEGRANGHASVKTFTFGDGLHFSDPTVFHYYDCDGSGLDCGSTDFDLVFLLGSNPFSGFAALIDLFVEARTFEGDLGAHYDANVFLDPIIEIDPAFLLAHPDAKITLSEGVGNSLTGGAGGVPEPASWALMILGLGGVGAVLRRRRPAAALV